jgi:hypothetical protein
MKMYDGFELELVAEYNGLDGHTYCEPYFQEEDFPENFDDNPNEPGFLDHCNVLRFFWIIYGRKSGDRYSGVEALIDSDNYKHIKAQFDFLVGLLELREDARKFVFSLPEPIGPTQTQNRIVFKKILGI